MTDDINDLDSRLSAYLDGELGSIESAALETLIASDPHVAARLEAIATARADFETTSHEIDDIPMSASLTATLERLAESRNDHRNTDNIVPFPVWRRTAAFIQEHRAVAASVAVAVGAMTLQTAVPAQVASVEGLPASGILHADRGIGQVLEASASGSSKELPDGSTITPRFTFASDNTYCRVADTASKDTQARFVACRKDAGWRVAIATFSAASGGSTHSPYQTASQAGSKSVERFLDATMTDAPLGAQEEAGLIKAGWLKQP